MNDEPRCSVHGKPMRKGNYGWYCATKLEDNTWCKQKAYQPAPAPRGNPGATQALRSSQSLRNFDKEAYEKCCSIWAAAVLGRNNPVEVIDSVMLDKFWNLFQAIRADGEKRFATGWARAEQALRKPEVHAPLLDEEPPIEEYERNTA